MLECNNQEVAAWNEIGYLHKTFQRRWMPGGITARMIRRWRSRMASFGSKEVSRHSSWRRGNRNGVIILSVEEYVYTDCTPMDRPESALEFPMI